MANYLVAKVFPLNFLKHQRDKLRSDFKYYIWDDPHLWKRGADQVIRICVLESEFQYILEFCHLSECGGHFCPQRTAKKVLDCGFWWPTLFKDASQYYFMTAFSNSSGYLYILLAVDYVSKWVKAIFARLDDANTVVSFIRNNIVCRYGSPRAIMSDQGTHFCNKKIEALLKRYRILHKVATAYHPQING
ncbi:uncharacterized protein LOC130956974 [Arachis stenosperma]|uniref:uncharacterized protein LOC130956974 n=1 Tax=Arachis stenosperma TaxID=217475 RepID=UPI0025AC63A2|nr:uncharacterized protein LOC130956974 [Arachis stenosperma]